MHMKRSCLPWLLSLATVPALAVGIGARAGTTGVGGDVAWEVAPSVSARVGYSGLTVHAGLEESGVDYDAHLKLSNLSAIIDWQVLGPFRLSLGGVVHDNRFRLRGRAGSDGNIELNGNSYAGSDLSLTGRLKAHRSVAPYMGLGYGSVSGRGVNFYGDFGFILQGNYQATLDVSCGSSVSSDDCTTMRSDAAAEANALEASLKNVRLWPVINIGLTMGF